MEKNWVKMSDVLFFQEGPGVRNTQYTTSGVKLLNVANLVDGKVDLSTSTRYISEDEAYGKYKHFLCDAGDFVVASSGIKVEYIDKKMGFIEESMLPLCMNTSTIRFKVINGDKLRIKYFMYYLKSQHFKEQLAKEITGSAQLNYGPSHLKKMILPLIDVSAQDEIIRCLDNIQKNIDMRRKELICFDELIRARFVEMFGDPFANEKKWQMSDIKAVCERVTDGEHGSVSRVNEGHPFLNAKHIKTDGSIDWNTVTYVSNEDHAKIYKRCNPEQGDILMTTTGTIGNIAVVPDVIPFSMDRGITLLKLNKNVINPVYLSWLLRFDSLQAVMKANVHASAIGHLFLNQVERLPVMLPGLQLQNQFADLAREVDKSKDSVQKALDEAQLLFDSLMQQYFG